MDVYTSDESCDSDVKSMKTKLCEFGLGEERLSREEMANLLAALNNSQSTAREDQQKQKVRGEGMKRRYMCVRDRRLPWSLLPSSLTCAQRAATLAVYIELLSINRYRAARRSVPSSPWSRVACLPAPPLRATRSGRAAPSYQEDDEEDDLQLSKRRRTDSLH